MNNVIHVDFKRKSLTEYNKQETLQSMWNKVYQLDKWIHSRLSIKQYEAYTLSTKYIDRAKTLKIISKSKELNRYAAEMIDLINEINLLQNTTEKVYTANDIPF